MKKVNYAAIDVGSNAVRLLIKGVDKEAMTPDEKFSKELLLRVPLRLGFDVFTLGALSDAKAVKLKRLMKAFKQLMKIYDVVDYRACATSAMRDAKNGSVVLKNIEKDTGIHIDVIDGKEEAAIIYNNHMECITDRTGNYMYVDVGGGSTEINFLTNGELIYSNSYNIGTVRMLSNAVDEEAWITLREDLTKLYEFYPNINLIGSGGNINKLFRLAEKKDKKLQRMTISSLEDLYEALKILPLEERVKQFKLKMDRADVIIPAAEIYLFIANIVKPEYIYVPIIGLSDGIIDNLLLEEKQEEN
ncbi:MULTISPECIES: Ppx/GppA family phosphatase [unclassified Bacteroides]|jgi:exopolyphosphatase/guanosine-5'-triphosphate,3'-diphosphate pyrophosphatase|uniref:Ppx/GppA phosphatase family protein n=1 Tax=unclassified Bacteroides TaxID=2646097 RepID=UPI000E92DA1D|nr:MULTISPECIES: Ppx/GppA family phosphatase [unclassified Bacteroides]RGN47627.1 Ppx/GppA family phosphatase [Bacteroides sp. OM05-12]RHR75353.1 Ppx/GppA family phosphatase [Bacteroides sp. AF16-49]